MSGPVRLDADLLRSFPLPPLAEDGDKEDRGRIVIVAGSPEVPGAAVLAGIAAMRAGAGRLRIVTDEKVATAIGIAATGARVIAGFSAADRAIEGADAVTIGCGMDPGPELERLLAALLGGGADMPLVLDAAALDCLPPLAGKARARAGGLALLPHAREMACLLGCAPEEVEIDPPTAVRRAAERYHAVALVKGRFSLLAAPDGRVFCFEGGGVGLATSGSGDVLAGLVGGLAARGADVLTATLWGVWLHGEAGRILTERVGRIGFLADEIAPLVPGLLEVSSNPSS
jgi:ADP-dependent NAD(P)H-hydrate dehydratase